MKKGTLNRRGFLAGAAAGAGLGYTGVQVLDDWEENQEKPTADRAQREIDALQASNFDRDAAFFANAEQPAVDRVIDSLETPRHQYLYDEFNSQSARFMPSAIQRKLAALMPGLAAQENRFRSDRVSEAGAVGFMQFLMSTYRGLGGKLSLEAFRDNFPEQVEFAFKYFDEEIYQVLDEQANFKAIGHKYGVSGDELNTFIVLSMVNAYKAGQTRMKNVLNAFLAGFAARSLPDNFDGTGLGLFDLMTQFNANYQPVSGYGPRSREYPKLAVAGAQSLSERYNAPYGLKEESPWLQTAGVGALVGAVLSDAKLDPTFKKQGTLINSLPALGKVPFKLVNEIKDLVASVAGIKKGKKAPSKTAVSLKQPKVAAQPKTKTARKSKKANRGALPAFTRRQAMVGGVATAAVGAGLGFKDTILDTLSDVGLESTSGVYDRSEVASELARLRERGIFLTSSTQGFNENGEVDGRGRTALVSMRKDVWATMEQLFEELQMLDQARSPHDEEAVIITGMAEDAGHSTRTHGHGPGHAIDLRNNGTNQTARRLSNRLLQNTEQESGNARSVAVEHRLRESGMLVGDKIFRYNSKYFLFGMEHQGRTWVAYFDAESTHRHLELIPWDDYNVESRSEFIELADLSRRMGGIWREEVKDHIEEHEPPSADESPWQTDFLEYMRRWVQE